MQQNNEAKEEAARAKYINAWNETMIRIWKEQITLLGVIDTGRLLQSPIRLATRADGKFVEVTLSQAFLEYGLWQDYGTGKETPRDNPGDIGHEKKRQRRRWFSKKYYASVMNIKDFMAENLGDQFKAIIVDAWNDKLFRRKHGIIK
ncbi:MAG: hypothetical protein MJZ60_08855 [Bacteroidaceae bacterium]|nr:hypothetical protein [Bacteroidaceae bacterium]